MPNAVYDCFPDDWKFKRASNQYYLGDVINIEASVSQYNHMPLRVFVVYCVATLEPDVNAEPQYAFIQNLGQVKSLA